MCDYDNGCGSPTNGCYNTRDNRVGCGCGICSGFGLGADTWLIIAIIILFLLLFGDFGFEGRATCGC